MLLDRLCWSVKYSSALNASSVKARSAPYHNVSRVLSETPSRSMGVSDAARNRRRGRSG
jgi:hypothetical protein